MLILADTDDIGVAGAGLTDLGGMSTGMKAEVEVEANDALVGQKLDHLVAAADGDDPVDGSIIAHMVSTTEDWSTFAPGDDSLQAARDHATTIKTDTAAILTDTGTTLDARLSKLTDAIVLSSSTIQTVTSQTVFVIPATADAVDDDAYNGAIAVFIDGTDPNQKSFRLITDYDAGTRKVTVAAAPDFTITTSDTLTILASTTANLPWDRILTGSTHNLATSAGRRLRQLEQAFVHASGTIAAVGSGHNITLDGGAVATADYYIGDRLQITEGVGAGQSRLIVAYNSSKVAILDSDFITNPNTASLYDVVAADVHVSLSDADLASGFVAVATNTTTITLDATNAVATTDYYKNEFIVFTHGTGAGQAREITGYTSGRVVTMSPALTTALDTDTVWHIMAQESVNLALDTAIAELGVAAPAATPTLRTAQMLLYMALRNKTITQTSGTDALEIHNDAGTKITKKLLTDDGADYAEAKMS